MLLKRGEDPGSLRFDVPYQMAMILTRISKYVKEGKVAVVARRCDEKAITELAKRDLLDANRVILIGLACDAEQVKEWGKR